MQYKYLNILFYLVLFINSCYGDGSITYISPTQIKDIGEEFTLNCTVDNPKKYNIVWAKRVNEFGTVSLTLNDILIARDDRTFSAYDASTNTYSLTFKNITKSDAGSYECLISITMDKTISKSVEVQIRIPPTITDKTNTIISVAEGNVAQLTCKADGFPRPTITWTRESNEILPAGGLEFTGNVLTINNVNKHDRGTYYCHASNDVGTPDSKANILEVEFAPTVKAVRPKVAQSVDYEISLECHVEAYPPPVISWLKNGQNLNNNDEYEMSSLATNNEITQATLRLPSVQKHHYGDYTCKAANKKGEAQTRINLFEQDVPNINYSGLKWISSSNQLEISHKLIIVIAIATRAIFTTLIRF